MVLWVGRRNLPGGVGSGTGGWVEGRRGRGGSYGVVGWCAQ